MAKEMLKAMMRDPSGQRLREPVYDVVKLQSHQKPRRDAEQNQKTNIC